MINRPSNVPLASAKMAPCHPVEVRREKNISVEDFESEFLTPQCPVVIEDYLAGLPQSNWSVDYLLSRISSNEVNVRGKTNHDDYKVGKNYTLRTTTFEQYISDMRKANARGLSSYMAVQNISKAFPEISCECEMPKYVKKVHNGPFLWIAHQGHYEFCHFDPSEGMLMMIRGRKRVKLYSSSDLSKLYPNPLGSKGKTIQSRVNCEQPDVSKYPDFEQAQRYECVLEQGDMLFIPAFWWHQVTSETEAVSVNVFFGDAGTNRYLSRHLTSPSWPAFRYWILNVVEQNRQYESFRRTLERLTLCVEYFLLKQYHEVATKDQLDFLVEMIMEYVGVKVLPEFTQGGKHPPPLKIRGLRWR